MDIPVIAIGGITCENTAELAGSGICGIAVISSLFGSRDIEKAAEELKRVTKEMVEKRMKIKGVILMWTVSLLDTMPVWTNAGAVYLKSLGIEAEPHLGDKLFTMTVDMGAVYLKEKYKMSQSLDEIIRGINGVVEDCYYCRADFKPGAKELLETLYSAEIPMTIASSTGKNYIAAAMERLDADTLFQRNLKLCGAENQQVRAGNFL